MLKTYVASASPNTGSSGFTNYFGRKTPEQLQKLHDDMREELGEFVIVDGSDNWSASDSFRPEIFIRGFTKVTGREPIALYHSGISGMTKSGVVLKPEDFDALTQWYAENYGRTLEKAGLKLTFMSNSTSL